MCVAKATPNDCVVSDPDDFQILSMRAVISIISLFQLVMKCVKLTISRIVIVFIVN